MPKNSLWPLRDLYREKGLADDVGMFADQVMIKTIWTNVKNLAAAVVVGFLIFAPPGTLIVTGLAIAAFLGKTYLYVLIALVLPAAALIYVIRRRKRKSDSTLTS